MENFNLKKFLVENKLTTNSRLLSEDVQSIRTFHFGHDNHNIQQVQDYLLNHYNVISNQPGLVNLENGVTPDCKIWFEHNQIMGALDIYNPDVLQDNELQFLIGACVDVYSYSDDDDDDDDDELFNAEYEFDTHRDTLGHFDDDQAQSYISEPFFTPEDFYEAEDDESLLDHMKTYNKDQAEVYNTVKNGTVLWNFDEKMVDVGVFKKMVEKYRSRGKSFYYVYCEPGESIGVVEITLQEAVEAVGAYSSPKISDFPDRLPFGSEFEIYAV